MRTMTVQQAVAPAAVSEQDQIFTQNAYRQRQVGDFLRHGDRMPEAAHIFSTRGAGTDMSEHGVLGRAGRLMIAAVCLSPRFSRLTHAVVPQVSSREAGLDDTFDPHLDGKKRARQRLLVPEIVG